MLFWQGVCATAETISPRRSQRRRVLVFISTLAACSAVAALAYHDQSNHATGNALFETAQATGHSATPLANHAATTVLASVDPGTGGTVEINTETSGNAADGAGEGGSSNKAHAKPCDEACETQRAAAAAKMKALQDSIYHDFDSMISFGNAAGYVPPPQSMRQQVMDGTLMTGGGQPQVKPPAFDAPNPLEIAGEAANVQLDPSRVHAIQKQLAHSSASEEKQLEAQVDQNVAASDAPVSAAFAHTPSDAATSSPAGAGAASASGAAPSEPSRPIVTGADPVVGAGPAPAPRASIQAAPAPAPAAQPPSQYDPAQAAAGVAPPAPQPQPATAAAAAAADASPWAKAFAFIKDTSNPLLGSGANDLQAPDAGAAGRASALPPQQGVVDQPLTQPLSSAQPDDPLQSDGFLKSYFGHA